MVKQLFSIMTLVSALVLPVAMAQTGVRRVRRRRSNVDATTPVTYDCTFTNTWLPNRHPAEFPSGPGHFTRFIMASHSSDYVMFAPNTMASPGVRDVAENGGVGTLNRELTAAGEAVMDSSISSGEIDAPLTYTSSLTITGIMVNGSHPLLSAVSMIAPSPDWFSGMYNLNMVRTKSKTYFSDVIVELAPWDAGTETGDRYRLGNPAENPQQPVSIFTADNVPSTNVFLSPEGDTVLPVLNLHCYMSSPENNKNPLSCNAVGDTCDRNRDCRCRRNVCRPSNGVDICLPCLLETQTCTRNGECCNGLTCDGGVCVEE